jgi:CheY-like chemotaxis protein
MVLRPILCAEEEENDAFFLQRAFRQAAVPNPLIVVPDGQAAIDYCSASGQYTNREEYPLPCLLLLDLNMPKKSGLEVLKWIRAQPSFCTLPVVVVTSSTQDVDLHRAYIQGANAYLVKPAKPNDLIVMVKAINDFWLRQNRRPDEFVDLTSGQSG